MEERLRQKFVRLADDTPATLHYVHQIYNLIHREPVVDWLLRHGIKGQNLVDWVQTRHESSIFAAISFVVGQINLSRARPVKGADLIWEKPKVVSP